MESFDPATHGSWVVSDLRSKFELQRRLLLRDGGYLDTSILRASDLWRLLLKKTRPDLRIVSRDFARSLVRGVLRDIERQLQADAGSRNGAAVPHSDQSVMAAMDRFASVVFHPHGEELMREWFAANPESFTRWGGTYAVARLALRRLIGDGFAVAKWAAAILQNEPVESAWDLPLIVDLGPDLGTAEAQLFLRLSKHVDVKILEPFPEWRDDVEAVLRSYADVTGSAPKPKLLSDPGLLKGSRRALRLSGQLAEVKEAVACARRWLEEGVPPEEIAILAPEIEEYWPVLKAYLDEEGIPADKAVAAKLNSFPSLNRWLARLRPRRGDLTSPDLELMFYSSESANRLRHEEFHQLFANLYGEEDLARHDLVKKAYQEGPRFAAEMDRDTFLTSAALLWDRRDPSMPLQQLGREVLQNASPGTVLPLSEWIRYVESVAANREIGVESGSSAGILVTNLPSARAAKLRRRVFLGLTEEGLRKAERNPLPLADVGRLADIGFHLEHPDHSTMEFELRWLADAGSEEDVFLMGIAGFDGSIRAPSSFWLKESGQEKTHSVDVPAETRWDLLQRRSPDAWARERGWTDERTESLVRRLRVDLGDEEPSPAAVALPSSVSPSFVRSYLDCPFTVAAGALFRLYDLEEIDLDLQRSRLGTLSHAVFQGITDQGWLERDHISDQEIEELISAKRESMGLIFPEESWWPPFLKRQMRVVREFLRVEKEWKKAYSSMRLLPSESSWKLFFDPATSEFHREEAQGRLRLSGRIDRLETDGEGRFVVVDYKAGASNLHDQADWLGKNDLQLLFYMWALERGALAGVEGRVVGAFYYVYRDFSRQRGFQLESEAGRLFPPAKPKSKRNADDAKKQELFKALEERIVSVIRDVKAGKWNPSPRKAELCQRCAWNGLCRAPHLS